MSEIISNQKRTEWMAIKNIIPFIEDYLQINDIYPNEQFKSERPDFIFNNGMKFIGIEVVECHPSVKRGKKDNAPAKKNFKNKVCKYFENNSFLKSITECYDNKLNIFIDRGPSFNMGLDIELICQELECYLRAWYYKEPFPNGRIIKKIRVFSTRGQNIVQFNEIARRDPISFLSLKKSIDAKQLKYDDYAKKVACDEYWLCVYLPFEENVQSNRIVFEDEDLNTLNDYLQNITFNRICITSVMPNDIHWIKGNPKESILV